MASSTLSNHESDVLQMKIGNNWIEFNKVTKHRTERNKNKTLIKTIKEPKNMKPCKRKRTNKKKKRKLTKTRTLILA